MKKYNSEKINHFLQIFIFNLHHPLFLQTHVDKSCIGSPVRAGFGGIICNSAGFYLAGFSGFLPSSLDSLQAELTVIYHSLSLAKEMGIADLLCYSDSLLFYQPYQWQHFKVPCLSCSYQGNKSSAIRD